MIKLMIDEMIHQRNAANQHLLETLGITMDNRLDHEISMNQEGEIVRVQRVMKATIWEKKQNDTFLDFR